METQQTSTGGYTRLHVFLFSMAYLWTMLTLDVVYSLLTMHGFLRKRMAARRERLEARRLTRETAARIPVASAGMQDELASSADSVLDSDIGQAA